MAPVEPLKKIVDHLRKGSKDPRACLIICPDQIRQSRVVDKIRESIGTTAELIKVDGNSLNEDSLRKTFFSLQNNSLFSSERHLLIRNVDAMNAALAKSLIAAIKDIASTVVIATAAKLATNLSLYKYFDSPETLFTLKELTGQDLEKWIAKELVIHGVKNFPGNAPAIIRVASGESPDTALELVSKIALFVDGESATAADIQKLIAPEGRVDEFDFISRIVSTPRPRLEMMVTKLLSQGVSPFPLLALLHRNYASYYSLNHLLKSGLSPEQCAGKIDSPPWLIKKIAPLAQKYTSSQLSDCLAAIARADSLLKNRSLGNESIFSELLETLHP